MKITVTGAESHNGFLLDTPFTFNGSIVVLTGKNGSGKTRLLESIKNNKSIIYLNGDEKPFDDIGLISANDLRISIENIHNEVFYNQQQADFIQAFDIVKNTLDSPEDYSFACSSSIIEHSSVDTRSLYNICHFASKNLNKPTSELTHDDIILHFEPSPEKFHGLQNISIISNRYIKRKNQNDYNKWMARERNTSSGYYIEPQFIKVFGEKPWILVNEILDEIFLGKFKINIPDENSLNYNYHANLMLSKDETVISTSQLSSGEKTLLWLTSMLFTCQYHKISSTNSRIILLDEPDVYLHPKMVLQMYNIFKYYTSKFDAAIIITTHSPTSVALAPEDNVYHVNNNSIAQINKDRAISDLLDGVTQISLNPENRRQVFVESQYDVNVYQRLYSRLVHRSKIIDPMISISFISAGSKVPKERLIGKAKQILKVHDESLLEEFVSLVNGVGNCDQVIAQVEALVTENENYTVRGIIDWDKENNPSEHIKVFAHEYAYSIENITLDPICILLLIHTRNPLSRTMMDICGKDIYWSEWLKNKELLQESVDRFILNIFNRPNNKNAKLKYMSQLELETDLEYLTMQGHALEKIVMKCYCELGELRTNGKDGALKVAIVEKSMINLTNGDFIPQAYEKIIAEVQR
ncbi:ATP-binding protein [Escherichia coli]|uniref:ATP-binding protein n=1 Tax=Escherichia coli TaxID=562 RepID=UPI001142840D|nr:ATP-binding protein [Klebsiella quasipneumoniae]TQD31150.1 ATP-binding protein [Klebsiella quasipneumoniae]